MTLRKGQLVDRVFVLATSDALDQAGLQSVANAMAERLDAGYSG